MIAVHSKEAVGIPHDGLGQQSEGKPEACDRLDSWKEIAAHFRRSVRCVQRWERSEGLPVLRHQHAKGATVYAYRHAVDRWWEEERTVVIRERKDCVPCKMAEKSDCGSATVEEIAEKAAASALRLGPG